jgi:hypothetical protein
MNALRLHYLLRNERQWTDYSFGILGKKLPWCCSVQSHHFPAKNTSPFLSLRDLISFHTTLSLVLHTARNVIALVHSSFVCVIASFLASCNKERNEFIRSSFLQTETTLISPNTLFYSQSKSLRSTTREYFSIQFIKCSISLHIRG